MSIPKAWSGVEVAWRCKLRHLGETPKLGDLVRVPNREEGRPFKWVDLGKRGLHTIAFPILEDLHGCTHYPICTPIKKKRPSTTKGSPVSAPSMCYPARQNNGRFQRVSHSIGSELK
jgi:hypothetical protein